MLSNATGAYPGFLKVEDEEPVRSAGFEPSAANGEQRAKQAAAGVRGLYRLPLDTPMDYMPNSSCLN